MFYTQQQLQQQQKLQRPYGPRRAILADVAPTAQQMVPRQQMMHKGQTLQPSSQNVAPQPATAQRPMQPQPSPQNSMVKRPNPQKPPQQTVPTPLPQPVPQNHRIVRQHNDNDRYDKRNHYGRRQRYYDRNHIWRGWNQGRWDYWYGYKYWGSGFPILVIDDEQCYTSEFGNVDCDDLCYSPYGGVVRCDDYPNATTLF